MPPCLCLGACKVSLDDRGIAKFVAAQITGQNYALPELQPQTGTSKICKLIATATTLATLWTQLYQTNHKLLKRQALSKASHFLLTPRSRRSSHLPRSREHSRDMHNIHLSQSSPEDKALDSPRTAFLARISSINLADIDLQQVVADILAFRSITPLFEDQKHVRHRIR